MRVISQDGALDIPYEQVVIQRFNGEIYFLNKNLTGIDDLVSDIVIAKYSTEEKSKESHGRIEICLYVSQPCKDGADTARWN